MDDASPINEIPTRRNFLSKFVTVILGLVSGLVSGVAGLLVIFDPLRRGGGTGAPFLRVTTLDTLPADGVPRDFRVITDKRDAWTTQRQVPIGAVYLIRRPEDPDKVVAFNTICPHLGCFVNVGSDNAFVCPCHNSNFHADGSRAVPNVALRGLDKLETKVEDGKVLVQFMNFHTSKEEKIPKV